MLFLLADSSENLRAAETMHATSEKVDQKHVLEFTETLRVKLSCMSIKTLAPLLLPRLVGI